jgi:tRNA pseudouridine38-40 synthase
MLPDDIKIKSLKNVDPDFNARFSAKSKEYIYKINLDKDNVFLNNYALLYIKPIDIKKIKECASFFVGVHNFLSFSISDIEDTVRTISTIKVIKKGKLIEIRVVGNGFLRGMVRMLIGAILDYNEDKKTKEDITKLLNNPKKGSSITKVRACGLYLNKVRY